MIPKIIFRYSKIYDEFLGKEKPPKKEIKKVFDFMEKLEKLWKKDEKKVTREISKITNLDWKEKEIYCYVVRKGDFSLSDPLTLVIYNKKGRFKKVDFLIDFLVHELIHQIFVSRKNFQKSKEAWKYIYEIDKNKSEKTKIHILIHAIHNYIYLKFYNKKRLKRDINWAQKHKDYRYAWEIIQKQGYQKIINEFNKRVE